MYWIENCIFFTPPVFFIVQPLKFLKMIHRYYGNCKRQIKSNHKEKMKKLNFQFTNLIFFMVSILEWFVLNILTKSNHNLDKTLLFKSNLIKTENRNILLYKSHYFEKKVSFGSSIRFHIVARSATIVCPPWGEPPRLPYSQVICK